MKVTRLKSLIIILCLSVFLSGCSKQPIKIGFIGDLTSKNSQLSIDARNAVEYSLNNFPDKNLFKLKCGSMLSSCIF